MSAKMAAIGIRTHAHTKQRTYSDTEVAAMRSSSTKIWGEIRCHTDHGFCLNLCKCNTLDSKLQLNTVRHYDCFVCDSTDPDTTAHLPKVFVNWSLD